MLEQDVKDLVKNADCLFSHEEVEQAISNVATELNCRFNDSVPLVMPVMNGGLIFAGKLLTQLNFPLQVDYIHATRYRDKTSGGDIQWRVKPSESVKGRDIILVDDILDEGHTLVAIQDYLNQQGVSSITTVMLLDKHHDRKAIPAMQADIVGLVCEDRYVFGYGMDYKGYWRNANGIFALKE